MTCILDIGVIKGIYEYNLSAQKYNLSSGVYFVKLETESGITQSIKIILIK